MKILYVVTLSELGGAQSVVINLANKLINNHEIIVVAGEGDGKMYDLLDKKIIKESIPSLVRRLSPINELKTVFALKKLYKKYKPDVIHLHSSKAGLLGRLAFPKKKIIYTVHGFDSIRIAYRKFLPIEKLLQFRCASIVGVSQYDEKNLLTEGIKKNVTRVYNGINQPISLSKDPFKNINKRKGIILCIARVSPQKNLTLFIQVASSLPDYTFLWIGNQEPPSFYYPENVYFLGNISNAGAYTKYADLFFLPSNYEGLPMVIIEALSSGTPVIASSVGGITELLDGKNGWAVENDVGVIKKIIQNYFNLAPEEKIIISQKARSTYLSKFTVDQMADGYLDIYNNIK